MQHSMPNHDAVSAVVFKRLKVTSSAFEDGGVIPTKYTCDGENINPPLDIADVAAGTRCLVIIVEDPDAPFHTWTHWLAWNIHATKHIKEGLEMEAQGTNDFHEARYCGPCPISGTHHYHFKVYALSELLDLPETTSAQQLEKAMSEHIVGFGEIIGEYTRQ